MLREIEAAKSNNTASHMMSQNQLTVNKMPPKTLYLSEVSAMHQPTRDMAKVGADTRGDRPMDNFIDYRA